MAIITFSRKEFEKDIGKLDEKMQNQIAMLGTTLEKFNAEEIEIEVFPNRPDLLSYHGFKRALLAFLGKKKGLKEYKLNKPGKDFIVKIEKSVNNIRPYTACAIVKNLKFNDEKIKEVIDIQEKLHTTVGRNRKKLAIGVYPLEKITLPIQYKAESPEEIKFLPLEETQEMTGRQILMRTSTGREYSHLLKDKQLYPVFRDSKNEVLSMPPIINSQLTGKVDEKTEDVFIECSGFDLEVLKKTLSILVTTLAEMGGEIYQMNLQYPSKKIVTPDLSPEKIKISIEDANKLLGLDLKETEVKKLLEKMGYNYNPKNKEVEIPSYRVDILHPVDIYEDIAIAYGYENITPEIPNISTLGEENETEVKKRKITEILTGLGFLEISTYHLSTKKEQFKNMNLKQADNSVIEVLDSKTEFSLLRNNLLAQACRVLMQNSDSEFPQKIFEIGKVFSQDKETGEIIEKEKLCITIAGETNFTEIKQILEYLLKMLDLKIEIKESEHPSFIEGRVGKIMLNKKDIGVLGEVSPQVLKNWKIKMPVSALEIEIEGL